MDKYRLPYWTYYMMKIYDPYITIYEIPVLIPNNINIDDKTPVVVSKKSIEEFTQKKSKHNRSFWNIYRRNHMYDYIPKTAIIPIDNYIPNDYYEIILKIIEIPNLNSNIINILLLGLIIIILLYKFMNK